jgi:hypothetical protein
VQKIIERLNEAFGSEWSLELEKHEIRDDEVIVLVRLSAAGVVKMAFGTSGITLARESGKSISIGDDLKSATSDGLKKAASLLGVALELSVDREEPVPERKPGPQNIRPLRRPSGATPPDESSGRSTAASTTTLTSRQQSAILRLGGDLGMSSPELKTWILKSRGVPLERLSTKQASELIGELQARLTGRPGRTAERGAA